MGPVISILFVSPGNRETEEGRQRWKQSSNEVVRTYTLAIKFYLTWELKQHHHNKYNNNNEKFEIF